MSWQKYGLLEEKTESVRGVMNDAVADNKVTFTMTSYSPIAVMVNTAAGASATSPKTGDVFAIVAMMTTLCGAGAVVLGKKNK